MEVDGGTEEIRWKREITVWSYHGEVDVSFKYGEVKQIYIYGRRTKPNLRLYI